MRGPLRRHACSRETVDSMDSFVRYTSPDAMVDIPRDFHAAVTISWGELRDGGVIDWSLPDWSWSYYDDEQKARLERRMDLRFWYREIGVLPPDAFRRAFLHRLEEAMRIARLMYDALKASSGILVGEDTFHKSRDVASDFPATLLNGSSQDYASNAVDREYETVRERGLAESVGELLDRYRDPDDYIIDRLEVCFSQLVSVSVDGF